MSFDPQSVFDLVAVALTKQGRPSRDAAAGMCYYRHPANPHLKCAVGHLIPDDSDVVRDNANGTVNAILADYPDELDFLVELDNANPYFLERLQRAHDKPGSIFEQYEKFDPASFPLSDRPQYTGDWLTDWATDMRIIAAHHGLDASVLN